MDALSLLRMLGALGLVLGILVGALWLVRRYDLTLPREWLERLGSSAPERRLQVVERLAIDQRRSVVLLRRDDREFSVMVGPEGVVLLDSSAAPAGRTVGAPSPEAFPTASRIEPTSAKPALQESFASKIPVLPDIWFSHEPAPDRTRDAGGFH
ncbi:flagellar biogenesis protein [Novosphingobium sp. FGD1]|uniref:Flagellar biogenesis protein n=1 Tax=Novosphingobium silvae TaxID=2692619 RepID=A0A7X4GIJ7_9SPHN|nr:flagellar biogenesis protein [Novosphingobium silvae]